MPIVPVGAIPERFNGGPATAPATHVFKTLGSSVQVLATPIMLAVTTGAPFHQTPAMAIMNAKIVAMADPAPPDRRGRSGRKPK